MFSYLVLPKLKWLSCLALCGEPKAISYVYMQGEQSPRSRRLPIDAYLRPASKPITCVLESF